MSETEQSPSPADEATTHDSGSAPAAPNETNTGSDTTDEGGSDEGTREPQRVQELTQWAQTEIRKARDEAKKYRQTAREQQETANQVPDLQSQVSELQAMLSTRDNELGKLRAVLNTGRVTDPAHIADVAERIQGSTQDELNADAEKVADLFSLGTNGAAPQQRPDPSQGNGHAHTQTDPMEAKVRRVLGM